MNTWNCFAIDLCSPGSSIVYEKSRGWILADLLQASSRLIAESRTGDAGRAISSSRSPPDAVRNCRELTGTSSCERQSRALHLRERFGKFLTQSDDCRRSRRAVLHDDPPSA